MTAVFAGGIFSGAELLTLFQIPASGTTSYVPTGILRQPYLAKLMLAECATFQSNVGAANATAAKLRIALFEAEERDGQPDQLRPPRAIIMYADDWQRINAGTSLAYSPRGSLAVVIELPIPSNYAALGISTREDECNWFTDQISDIMQEVEALVNARAAIGGQNPLFVRSWSILEGPDRETAEERYMEDPETGSPTIVTPPQRTLWWCTLQWALA